MTLLRISIRKQVYRCCYIFRNSEEPAAKTYADLCDFLRTCGIQRDFSLFTTGALRDVEVDKVERYVENLYNMDMAKLTEDLGFIRFFEVTWPLQES